MVSLHISFPTNLPLPCMNDLDWIIIFFVIHINALGVEKWRNHLMRLFFLVGPSLEKLVLKTSRSVLRDQVFHFSIVPFHVILHTYIFPTTWEARQEDSVCESYATQNLTLLFSPPWFDRMLRQPPLSMGKGLAMWSWCKRLYNILYCNFG